MGGSINQAHGKSCRSESLQMDHLGPSLHHLSYHSAHRDGILSEEILRDLETDSSSHTLAIAQQVLGLRTLPKTNETKPRLGKDEVEILEREFKRNPKPMTQIKRQFAEDMGVDLARINNWFQNRRAKRKQEKKQEAYEARQAQQALGQYSKPSSPDFNYSNGYFNDGHMLPLQHLAPPFGLPSRPPPPAAPYSPQYSNPTTASMESLFQTMAAAQAASERGYFSEQNQALERELPASKFSEHHSCSDMTLYPLKAHEKLPSCPDERREDQNPDDCTEDLLTIGCVPSEVEPWTTSSSAPSPRFRFKSPPPPSNIASRRHKVHAKPVALTADVLRTGQPASPRTISNAEETAHLTNGLAVTPSPPTSLDGKSKSILSMQVGRVDEFTVKSPQPISIKTGFAENDCTAGLRDIHPKNSGVESPSSFQYVFPHCSLEPPSLIGSDGTPSNKSDLGPFTPTLFRERGLTLSKREISWLTVSPSEASMNFVFNSGTGRFTTTEDVQNVCQPNPPQIENSIHLLSPWPAGFDEKQWQLQVPDEPLYASARVTFPTDIRKPEPSHLQSNNPPKTFQFSHCTPADFLDECKPHLSGIKCTSQQIVATFSGGTPESLLERSAYELDDGSKEPQTIKKEHLVALPETEEGCSANDSTIIDEVQIKVERDYNAEADLQEEDLSENDSCEYEETESFNGAYRHSCNIIPKSSQANKLDGFITPILDPAGQALIERIMDEFWVMFSQDWVARITQCSGGTPASGDGKGRGTTVEVGSLSTSQQKRQRSDEEDLPDESGNKKPRRQGCGSRSPSKLGDPARFACPFRKQDPQKYSIHSHRVCALTSFETIARVKEHLYRNHKAAPYCKRCWKIFETEELLDSHDTVPRSVMCEAIPGHPPEGITPKQATRLRSKAKTNAAQSEADRWKDIFRLLFPGESAPSPYWEPVHEYAPVSPNAQVLASYEHYMQRELPRLVRSKVEDVVRREMQPVEESLLANLERLIRECQHQLSSGFRETQGTEQQLEVLPLQSAVSVAESANQIDTAEKMGFSATSKDQQPSFDFFDAILQPPPIQEEDYVLDFSAVDEGLFDNRQRTLSSNPSDSGYVSVPHCSCEGLCRCLASVIGFENQDVEAGKSSFVGLASDLEVQAQDLQWQKWLDN